MKFANPAWFFALIPTAILFYLRLRYLASCRAALPFSDLSLLERWVKSSSREEFIMEVFKILGAALMVIALARPQAVDKTSEPPKPVVDIILALDTSMSMAALDFDPDDRLAAAKKAAADFIRKRPQDRMGLVVFGGKAILQCPLTLDHESLVEFLQGVELNATQAEGTAIGTALALAAGCLADSEAKSKVVILLTDGRSNTGNIDPRTAAGAAQDLGVKVYAIGCAVPGGGVIPVDDPVFGRRLVRAAEDLDEPTLSAIAAQTGAKYFRVTSEKKFKEIYEQIDKLEKTKVDVEETVNVDDRYFPFLMAALLLIVLASGLKNFIWRTVP